MNVRAVLGAVAGIGTMLAVAGTAHADSLRWAGEVDDTATIRIHQRDVRATANKDGIHSEHYDVNGRLPQAPVRVTLTREAGRGDVFVVQQPSARNDYTAIVRIKDNQSGRGRYAFSLNWGNPRTPAGNGGWHRGHRM